LKPNEFINKTLSLRKEKTMKNIVKSLLVGTLSVAALAVCAEDKTILNLTFD
jgi:hypothetical protein